MLLYMLMMLNTNKMATSFGFNGEGRMLGVVWCKVSRRVRTWMSRSDHTYYLKFTSPLRLFKSVGKYEF